jgi:hypothetical protein
VQCQLLIIHDAIFSTSTLVTIIIQQMSSFTTFLETQLTFQISDTEQAMSNKLKKDTHMHQGLGGFLQPSHIRILITTSLPSTSLHVVTAVKPLNYGSNESMMYMLNDQLIVKAYYSWQHVTSPTT